MRSLIETLPSAIVLVDGDDIVGWNSAATALYGWPAHDAIGQSFRALLVDDADLGEVNDVFAHAVGRGKWTGNFRITRRDGALLVSSFVATLVHDNGQPRVAWVATDVVDQHLAEQEREVLVSAQTAARRELESTLGLLQALLECAPIGIAMLDLQLCCTHANTMFAEMLGAERKLVGAFLDDLATLPSEVAADLRRVVTTGRSIDDRRLTLRTGGRERRHIAANYFPIYSGEGEPAGAGLTWTDVTEAEHAAGERADLARQATAAQQRLAVLASASAIMMGTTEIDALLERLTRVLAPSAADWAVIQLIGRGGIVEHIAASTEDRAAAARLCSSLLGKQGELDGSVTAHVMRSGQAQLVVGGPLTSALRNAAASSSHSMFAELGLSSAVVVPIKSRGDAIGVLIMGNVGDAPALTDDDLDVAVEVGHRGALAIDRAIMYRNEHQLAQQLQQALLPSHLPAVERLRITSRYSAAADAATVGGDWFDVIAIAPGRVLLCIGDVIGHDTAAAVGMSRLRHLIAAFARESAMEHDGHPDPADILRRVDLQVYDDRSAWGTCILAELDLRTLEMSWSTAGHLPMLLARDGEVRTLEDAGTMLGVAREVDRTVFRTKLFTGDRLLMYTDGLVERRGESLDTGLGRLSTAMRDLRNQPLDRMSDEIVSAMLAGVAQSDDLAILVVDVVDEVGTGE